ncbi:VOC family protein [Shinella sp. S4-D37]|uniref:VOC family protein n=1 Tax=Shinella sp. S4-D37 TaxID=3161999 RepID=UPI003467B357
MLLYATVGTNDLARAGRFYDAVLPLLGYGRQKQAPGEIGYAGEDDVRCRFWVVEPFNRQPATFGNGVTVALVAPTRASVDAFHTAALAAGGTDEGAPGLRPFHANFYAAFIRDPDGNKLAAVCERAE